MSTELSKRPLIVTREVEVEAAPELVWRAIATGAGQAGWLFPAEFEERTGAAMVMHRQPFGGDAQATITAYEPLRRFAFEERMGEGGPVWATEFVVEARAGGRTAVRVVTGFHEGGEGWEPMVEGAAEGWSGALEYLRVYVPHFLGQPVTGFGVTGDTGRPLADRRTLTEQLFGALGLRGREVGDRFVAPPDAPPLAGVLTTPTDGDGALLRTDVPAPGMVEVSTFSMNGETVTVNVVGRVFGEHGGALNARDNGAWAAWLTRHFPGVEPVQIPG